MLLELAIGHFALIEQVRLQFGPGVNVLTGETGAGKSILLDAVDLLMGGRASVDQIRAGQETAVLQGTFSVADLPHVQVRLAGAGVPVDEDGQLIVSREIRRSGHNSARINDRLVAVTTLRELAEGLVDLHGQQDHQLLLKPHTHCDLLDNYGGAELLELRAAVAARCDQLAGIQADLARLLGGERDRARRCDLLRYQLDEISRAGLKDGEEEELTARRMILAHAERLQGLVAEAHRNLTESRGGDPIGDAIGLLRQAGAIDTQLAGKGESLERIQEEVQGLARDLRRYRDALQYDPEELSTVENRLELLRNLKRKYGDSVAEILSYRDQVTAELAELEVAGGKAEKLLAGEKVMMEGLAELAGRLSAARRSAAERLERQVEMELAELGMEACRFRVHLEPKKPLGRLALKHGAEERGVDARGQDEVEFFIAANPGEPLLPLARVASGGESSRIMLGLKSLLAAADGVPVLVFDEIDAGIGGRAAVTVARRLAGLGRDRQVLCVTHLAQIASIADRHFHIAKEQEGGRTVTRVRLLSDEGRVEELARMLGGQGGIAREHARQLLASGQRVRQRLSG